MRRCFTFASDGGGRREKGSGKGSWMNF